MIRKVRTLVVLFTLCLLIYFTQLDQASLAQESTISQKSPILFEKKDLFEHIEFLSNISSRFTGYPGSYQAAEYLAQKFRDYGLEVVTHKYKVLVPLEKRADIEVIANGRLIRIIKGYALYPNLIQTCSTPPEGVSGEVIYAGNGGVEELDGKDVEGKIVLMSFNTGKDWIDLIKLGAKAVIFTEPSSTDRMESMSKFVQTPIHFPRLYVTKEDGEYLKNALENISNLKVRVILRMRYEWVEAVNVIGIINGTEQPNDVIVVASHYDSWSVVPSKSPAADEASGAAALIELAKYFSEHPPRRSIWFVAFSGHWQGLAGAREFVEDIVFSKRVREGSLRIWMMINLDLSTGSNRLSAVHTSHFYKLNTPLTWGNWLKTNLENYIRSLNAETGTKFSDLIDISIREYGWWARIPSPYIADSDPMVITGSPAFTLRTSEDMRIFWGTPISDLSRVNLDNLVTQLTMIQYILFRFANEVDLGISWDIVAPQKFLVGGAGGGYVRLSGSGFITLQGKVIEYNITKGWFSPVPYALVTVRNSRSIYPFSTIVTSADKDGRFSIHGLVPSFITDPSTSYIIEAWVLNANDDQIEYAPNLGLYGREINVPVSTLSPVVNATVSIFRCKSVVLLDVYDPKTFMRSLVLDQRGSLEGFYFQTINILPYDFATGAESLWYGRYYINNEPLAILFVPPEERFMIKIDYGAPAEVSTFIVNSSSEYPEGYGYSFKNNDVIYISVPSQAAFDMYTVTKSRYSKTASLLLRNPTLEKYLNLAEKHLERAIQYAKSNIHSKTYEEELVAWSSSIMAYRLLMGLVYDSSITISAVVAIIIPAALFTERLLSTSSGYRRLVYVFILMGGMFVVFKLLFPGFNVMEIRGNPFIVIITIPLAYLLLFSTFLLLKVSSSAIRKRREEKLGIHEMERERLSFMLHSVIVSLRYMKRRRLRTILILTTIAVNSLSLTSFASISPYVVTREVALAGLQSPYSGLLFKRYDTQTFEVIDEPLLNYVGGLFNKSIKICPRVWLYPQTVLPQGDLISDIRSRYNSTKVQVIIGLSSHEIELLFGKALLGLNLRDEDTFACLISKSLSKALNVTVLDTISWNGIQFIVKGIFDESIIGEPIDIDGYSMAPFDPLTVSTISHLPVLEEVQPSPVSFHNLVVIPYEIALKLGGVLSSVEVRLNETEEISSIIDEISLLNMHIFIGKEGSTYSLSTTTAYAFIGIEPLLVLASLASLNILTIMLGIVDERKREIMIHSALGLDPRSSSLLFFFEILVYSIVGITIGYLVGINLNYLFITFNILPKEFIFNYSSSTILIILLILLAFSMSSVIYPAHIASRIVTPSHERKWKITTKPKGDKWEIPLPIVLSKREVLGVFRFIREYYEGATQDQLKTFAFRRSIEIDLESERPSLTSVVALAPFEANITQLFSLIAIPISKDQYTFSILLKKLTGIESRTA